MGVEPPYLYQRPSTYSFTGPTDKGFNPKAATQAAWAPRQPRPKPDGPLINSRELNRHPDSYFIVPYGNLDWRPMSPNTKTKVKWVRLLQLLLRVCALLGAVGLLVCVICIKPIGNSLDWIIRIPPGIAILHTTYAVYHLSRSSKGRTPGSSASYMIFASIMDAGLLPFLVFTAMMSHNQHVQPTSTDGHWTTLFGTDTQNTEIIFSVYLISVTTGGIHLASLCISTYLALVFRKISKMPPDMNPLEDNLTSRHKRNKSSISVVATSENLINRDSHLSAPLIDAPRAVPFMHTRNDSATSFATSQRSPAQSNRDSHRDSRSDLPSQVYSQPSSQRSSRTDLRRSPDRISPKRSSALVNCSPAQTRPTSMQQQSLAMEPAGENWFTHTASSSPSPENISPPEFRHLRSTNSPSPSQPQRNKYDFTNRSPRPLEMNPPTPPVASAWNLSPYVDNRALQPAAGNASPATWDELNFKSTKSVRGYGDESYGMAGKSRFYGNLRSSVGTKNRVVSSGVDEGAERAGLRGREVSGKLAEEGRAF